MAELNKTNLILECTFGLTIFCFIVCLMLSFAGIANSQTEQRKPNKPGKGPPGLVNTFKHRGDFSVIMIGTGSPAYNPKRSGPSALIHSRGNYFLVDMGNGTQARLIEAGIPFKDINAVMFTHLHLDHSEEFIPILINAWLQGQDNLKIFGPPRTKQYHEFLIDFYKEDMAYRAWRTGRSMEKIRNIEVREFKSNNSFKHNNITISTTEVPHTIYTLALRFDSGDKSIVISGDLSYSENLTKLAKDADILVMDSAQFIRKKGKGPRPRPRDRKHVETGDKNWPKPHASLDEVARMAGDANVKKLVLTHFGPGEIDKVATTDVMRKAYRGEIIFGEDLLEVVP